MSSSLIVGGGDAEHGGGDRAALVYEETYQPAAPQPRQGTIGGIPAWFCLFVLALFAAALGVAIGGYFLPAKHSHPDLDDVGGVDGQGNGNGNGPPPHASTCEACSQCPRVLTRTSFVDMTFDPAPLLTSGVLPYANSAYIVPGSNGKTYVYAFRTGSSRCNNPFVPSLLPQLPMGFEIIDITDPANPVKIGFFPAPTNTRPADAKVVENFSTPYFQGTALVMSYLACLPGTPHGIYVYNINNPVAPVVLGGPFGDSSPYVVGVHPTCAAANVFHEHGGIGAWSFNNRAYVAASDTCDSSAFFTARVDLFDITNPAAPVHVREFEDRDSSEIKWVVPTNLPVPNGGPSMQLGNTVDFRVVNGRLYSWTPAGSYGWGIFDLTNVNNFTLVQPYNWPANEWLNPDFPSYGGSSVVALSPNDRFLLARRANNGFLPATLVLTTGPNAGQSTLMSESTQNNKRLSSVGGEYCGPTIYVGYACNAGGPLVPAPNPTYIAVVQRGPTLDPLNAPYAGCSFAEKMANVAAAGYAAMLVTNSRGGASPPNTPDANLGTNIGVLPFPNTFSMGAPLRARSLIFNKDVNLTLPFPPAGDPEYDEPLVGDIGASICMQIETFRGDYSGVELMNATTLQTLAQYHPPESWNRRVPSSLSFPGFGSSGRPTPHRSAALFVQGYNAHGVKLISYGGRAYPSTDNSDSFALTEVASILPVNPATGAGMLVGGESQFVYDKKGSTYVMTLDPVGILSFYAVPECLLKPAL